MSWSENDFANKGLVKLPDGSFGKLPKKALPPNKKGKKKHSDLQNELHIKINTNALTAQCIYYLNASGYKVWRNNNHAVYNEKGGFFRKPPKGAINGVPDIIGYEKITGKFIGVEIKTGKDKLSESQLLFQSDCLKHNATYWGIRNIDELTKQIK